MASSWKSLSGVPLFTPDTMLLMTDGTVLVHDAGGKDWYRLKPDSNGKYDTAGVTWSGPFSMAHTRQFYASGVLADGRVFCARGRTPTQETTRLSARSSIHRPTRGRR